MAGTRSSARQAAQKSSPTSSQSNATSSSAAAGSKRKSGPGASPKSKRGKKVDEKEQKTIDETMLGKRGKEEESREQVEGEPSSEKQNGLPDEQEPDDGDQKMEDEEKVEPTSVMDDTAEVEGAEVDEAKDTGKVEGASGEATESTSNGNAVESSEKREESTPSSILEKGIIYFFFRGRVNIEEPQDVGDIARSYMVLRPMPHGSKLGDGPIGDTGNSRLMALPKKVLPKSHKDRFMVFVEKAKSTFEELKDYFISGSDYATKTAGTRHTPAATPVGEGVYAITTTDRGSHLAYILTIPSELSEVQKDIGLRERGSFVMSTKNPQYPGPANSNLPQGPNFSQEILDEFRTLRWMPTQPKHLDYSNSQFLIIGESQGELGKAAEQQPSDEKHDKDTPLEEMEKLEHEDEIRVEHLKGDDTVFADLDLSSKEYSKVQTTW